ncbi:NAD(+) diphosphatase [Colwellia sp. D2M02]|uniref:NAD(+) diphosphatase n=1 Tax=Colwellia sp. D2M02 TaxID=2841562 RepID=UPI001C087FAF|nr:NAD(+) diphosphatase [Colwellia sp. D2M02]MBU2894008.1 NAD(+) diphosphatase [Colwellia sp. D2M02]
MIYSNMPLDRCTNQRKNKRWLTAQFNHPNTLFCIVNNDMGLFSCDENSTKAVYLTQQQLSNLSLSSCIYLGKKIDTNAGSSVNSSAGSSRASNIVKESDQSFFAVNLQSLHFSTQDSLAVLGQWQSLRQVTANLSATDAAIQALAKALIHWHNTHQYCGKCGNISRSTEAGHARRCSECRNMSFPRTDPAVIMLVEHQFSDGVARCLLGRQASWKAGMYSTLAGFVDPGETLEEAVIREVGEETKVVVSNPQYITSQPWPFPASIMLGFTAVATSTAIDISEDDLEDCQWFSREQLDNVQTGSRDSISSYLIHAWKNKKIGQY